LTGERRGYKPSTGAFDRVKPLEDFGADGWGAFELTARYSLLDLTDRTIDGGRMSDVTLGGNWYMNPNMRAMLNLIRSRVTNYGFSYTLASRIQINF
jgi:phosphate-selective porin OprO/OprP